MKEKKGFLFLPFMTLLVILMMGIVVAMYVYRGGNVAVAVASPQKVVSVEFSQELFELQEQEYIQDTLSLLNQSLFGTEEFREQFRDIFLEKISTDETMDDFLFTHLYLPDAGESEARKNKDSFIRNVVYPESEMRMFSDSFSIHRAELSKEFMIGSEARPEISFPLRISYTFEKTYTITLDGNTFKIEIE